MSFEPLEQIDADAIILRSLSIMPVIETQSWEGAVGGVIEEQMHGVVQLRVIPPKAGFTQTVESDQLHTPSYFDLAQRILDGVHHTKNSSNQRPKFNSIEDLIEVISRLICDQISIGSTDNNGTSNQKENNDGGIFRVQILVNIPKLIRFANGISISITRHIGPIIHSPNLNNNLDKIFIDQITAFAIIGLLPRERLKKQKVICSLTIFKNSPFPILPHSLDLFKISETVFDKITKSDFFTVEALADSVAKQVINLCNLETVVTKKVKVCIEKPEAVSCALGAGVEIIKSI